MALEFTLEPTTTTQNGMNAYLVTTSKGGALGRAFRSVGRSTFSVVEQVRDKIVSTSLGESGSQPSARLDARGQDQSSHGEISGKLFSEGKRRKIHFTSRSSPGTRKDRNTRRTIVLSAINSKSKLATICEEMTQAMKTPDEESLRPHEWKAGFDLGIDQESGEINVSVGIGFKGTRPGKALLNNWRDKIQDRWNGDFCVRYLHKSGETIDWPIVVKVEFPRGRAKHPIHHTITVDDATDSACSWGKDPNRLDDVVHEFGHLLGNKGEYHMVDGKRYPAPNSPRGNLMNNASGPTVAKHYRLIALSAAPLLATIKTRLASSKRRSGKTKPSVTRKRRKTH